MDEAVRKRPHDTVPVPPYASRGTLERNVIPARPPEALCHDLPRTLQPAARAQLEHGH